MRGVRPSSQSKAFPAMHVGPFFLLFLLFHTPNLTSFCQPSQTDNATTKAWLSQDNSPTFRRCWLDVNNWLILWQWHKCGKSLNNDGFCWDANVSLSFRHSRQKGFGLYQRPGHCLTTSLQAPRRIICRSRREAHSRLLPSISFRGCRASAALAIERDGRHLGATAEVHIILQTESTGD